MRGFSTDSFKVSTTDGRNFVLLEEFTYEDKNGCLYMVPAGSQSDGASTPPVLWSKLDLSWIPPFGWYWKAAFLHDWAYRYSQLPKNECDDLLLDAMEWLIDQQSNSGIEGVFNREEEELKARTIYEGVHLGGQSAFDGDRENRP